MRRQRSGFRLAERFECLTAHTRVTIFEQLRDGVCVRRQRSGFQLAERFECFSAHTCITISEQLHDGDCVCRERSGLQCAERCECFNAHTCVTISERQGGVCAFITNIRLANGQIRSVSWHQRYLKERVHGLHQTSALHHRSRRAIGAESKRERPRPRSARCPPYEWHRCRQCLEST